MPLNVEETSQFLARVSLFDKVNPEYLPSIAQRLEPRAFQTNQVIFEEGEAGDALYIVKTGSVGMFLTDPGIDLKVELDRLRTGQYFGEMSLFTGERRTFMAQAMEPDTTCLRIAKETFMMIVERIPQVSIRVSELLARRVEKLTRDRSHRQLQLTDLIFDADVYRLIPSPILLRHKMIPLSLKNGTLTMACVDPDDLAGLDEVRRIVRGVEVRAMEVRQTDFHNFMRVNAGNIPGNAPNEPRRRGSSVGRLPPMQWVHEDAKEVKVESGSDDIKLLVDVIVAQGIELEASDIHIEPELDGVQVRYRVAGYLQRRIGPPIPRAYHRAIASRIKVLADLDISQRRSPQDGRISCRFGERPFDLRISTLPTHEGEKIVMRILDTAAAIQPIEQLVLAEKVCRVVRQMVQKPHGVVFVCGPTGSGKTTTLYSAVGQRTREDTNITTVEDPVEYNIPGITQVSVNPDAGLDFASVLRAILRQDPNVILVGETRDRETGKIALEAGLTGHLVLTSLHTNDAIGTIQRLREMNLENYAIAAALVGVISQRLVRRLCPICAGNELPSPHVLDQLAMIGVLPKEFTGTVKVPVGCDTCLGTGYRGRVAVFEVLVADDPLREEIINDAGQFKLRETAQRGSFVPMARYSNYLLTQGMTTPDEILAIHAGRG